MPPPPLTSSFLKIETWNLGTMFIFKFGNKVNLGIIPNFSLGNRFFIEFMYFSS